MDHKIDLKEKRRCYAENWRKYVKIAENRPIFQTKGAEIGEYCRNRRKSANIAEIGENRQNSDS
jgi:hypothetical protein